MTDRRLVVPLVAPVYVTAVACTTGVLDGLLTPGARSRVVLACSTNVRNLAEGRWSTLVTSALSSSTPPGALRLLALLAGLGLGEVVLGPIGVLAGHVLPSLVVYGGLRAGIDRGWCDPRLAHNPDVGPSYLAVAVAVAVAVAAAVGTVPGGRRLLARIAGVLIPPLVGKATFTDVGHVLAALTGAGAEGLLTTVRRRSGPRRCRPAAHG